MSASSHSAFSPIRLNVPAAPTETPARPPLPTTEPPFDAPLLRAADLLTVTRPQKAWLWHGYLAPGNMTLLTSQWKSGKTTLTSVLLARLKAGGQLAGLPVAGGRAVVVSEESAEDWRLRSTKLDFGDHIGWFCRPFHGRPTVAQWKALLDRIADLHARDGTALVVIDPLSAFFSGKSEADALAVLEVLMSLRRLAMLGLSVLLLHHPRKGRVRPGQAARGSGALTSYADILIEMKRLRRSSSSDRRRRLRLLSLRRHSPKPGHRADGRRHRLSLADRPGRERIPLPLADVRDNPRGSGPKADRRRNSPPLAGRAGAQPPHDPALAGPGRGRRHRPPRRRRRQDISPPLLAPGHGRQMAPRPPHLLHHARTPPPPPRLPPTRRSGPRRIASAVRIATSHGLTALLC